MRLSPLVALLLVTCPLAPMACSNGGPQAEEGDPRLGAHPGRHGRPDRHGGRGDPHRHLAGVVAVLGHPGGAEPRAVGPSLRRKPQHDHLRHEHLRGDLRGQLVRRDDELRRRRAGLQRRQPHAPGSRRRDLVGRRLGLHARQRHLRRRHVLTHPVVVDHRRVPHASRQSTRSPPPARRTPRSASASRAPTARRRAPATRSPG